MVKIFLDSANLSQILGADLNDSISGVTTNPSLLMKEGILDYEHFAKAALQTTDKPISFEVFADDYEGMRSQALKISKWGKNVYVKIPITNTKGQSSCELIRELSFEGVKLNITAVMTLEQVLDVVKCISITKAIISVFAGRIADTGIDPMPMMKAAAYAVDGRAELLWASPREVLNIYQADQCGCHIITATQDLIKKMSLKGKDLKEYSLETVAMFYNDAKAAGYSL